MNREQIINAIRVLAQGQGFYGRLLENLQDMFISDFDNYDRVMNELENQGFKDILDMIIFFEEG